MTSERSSDETGQGRVGDVSAGDASLFDGDFIVDILRTHPLVYLGGMLQENPFFVPPSRFLAERDARAVG